MNKALAWFRERWRVWAAISFVLVVLIPCIVLSPTFQQCEYPQPNNKPGAHGEPLNGNLTVHTIRCLGSFIDANDGTLTLLATLAIAAFTGTLWIATNRQAELTREAIQLSQAEFNATHRPEIVVQSVVLHQALLPATHETGGRPLECIGAMVTCYNKGSTDATIEEVHAIITAAPLKSESATLPPPLERLGLPKTLASGMGERIRIKSEFGLSDARLRANSQEIHCIGWIWYSDMRGAHRQTRFIRRYDANAEEWVRVPDSPYEFAY